MHSCANYLAGADQSRFGRQWRKLAETSLCSRVTLLPVIFCIGFEGGGTGFFLDIVSLLVVRRAALPVSYTFYHAGCQFARLLSVGTRACNIFEELFSPLLENFFEAQREHEPRCPS